MSKSDRAQVYPRELGSPNQFQAPTRLPVPGDPAAFEVISSTYLVEDRRHGEPLSRPIYGQVADCPGWGRLARWAIQGRVTPCFGYLRINPLDADKAPEGLHTPADEVASTLSEIETLASSPRGRLRAMEVSPLEGEIARFKAAWPLIAEKIGLVRLRPARLFEPGNRVLIPQAFDARAGDVDWQGFLDKHLSGDFGTIGSYTPPPTDEASSFVMGFR
jgi:hypothetical protein